MNARGDIFPIISWLGLIIIALIIGYWFFSHFFAGKSIIERMENDLKNVRVMIDDACDTSYYNARYNPFIEQGILDTNSTHICIRSQDLNQCRIVLCEKLTANAIDLSGVKELVVEKPRGREEVNVRLPLPGEFE